MNVKNHLDSLKVKLPTGHRLYLRQTNRASGQISQE